LKNRIELSIARVPPARFTAVESGLRAKVLLKTPTSPLWR
jgi:hypothetical protein